MNVKAFTGFIIFLLVYTSLHVYFAWVISAAFPLPFWMLVSLFLFFGFSYFAGIKIPLMKVIGSLWMACFAVLFVLLPFLHAAYLLLLLLGTEAAVSLPILALTGILAFLLYWGFGLYYAYQPVTRSYTIELEQLEKPFVFVLASDMHFGGLSGTSHVKRLVKEVNRYPADLVLLCGDIVDDHPAAFQQKGQDHLLSQLQAARGVFAVTGNHEYYGKQIPVLQNLLQNSGITLLQDEAVYVPQLGTIIGRKDKTERSRKKAAELIRAQRGPIIVMDHQPSDLLEIEAAGADISVSGHTHRGQIWPFHLITRRIFLLDWGMKQFGQLHAVVSSGFGFWGPPIRIGSQSEIVHVSVKKK